METGTTKEQTLAKPVKPRKPTMKQQAFVKELLKTNNASEAIRRVYDVSASQVETIHSMAYENLSKPTIQALIERQKDSYLTDSYEMYAIQKNLIHRLSANLHNGELVNKIANKIQDRAGFSPTHKSQSLNTTAKFIITRGDSPKTIDISTQEPIAPPMAE